MGQPRWLSRVGIDKTKSAPIMKKTYGKEIRWILNPISRSKGRLFPL
jgi:hypothetical protein